MASDGMIERSCRAATCYIISLSDHCHCLLPLVRCFLFFLNCSFFSSLGSQNLTTLWDPVRQAGLCRWDFLELDCSAICATMPTFQPHVEVLQRFSMLGKERCKFSPYLRVSLLQHAWPWKRLLSCTLLITNTSRAARAKFRSRVGLLRVLGGQSVEVFTELIPLPLGRDLMEIQRPHFGRFASGTATKTPETMPQWSGKREMGSMQDCRSLICPTYQDFQTFPSVRAWKFGWETFSLGSVQAQQLRRHLWTCGTAFGHLKAPWFRVIQCFRCHDIQEGLPNSSAEGSIAYLMPMW